VNSASSGPSSAKGVLHVRREIERVFVAVTVLGGKEPQILGWDAGDADGEVIRASAM
jgi:hypothetical protein